MYHPKINAIKYTQPKARLKSFPVPSGKIAIGGFQSIDLIKLITLATVPSPPAIINLDVLNYFKLFKF